MGGSRASGSEIRAVQANYNSYGNIDSYGQHSSGGSRPGWLWGWVAVYVLLAILALVLISLWIGNHGGLQWGNPSASDLMYNYHPLFMVLGFVFIHGMTNIIYRIFPDGNTTGLKIAHGILQLTAFVLMCCGVYAVGYSKDYGKTPHTPHHFTSIHSWCGLALLTVMALQWVCGFFGLLVPGCKGERRRNYRSTHIFTGNLVFLLGTATVLIGLDELSNASSALNTLALAVVAYGILGAWFLSTDLFKRGHREHVDEAGEEERAPLTGAGGTRGSRGGDYVVEEKIERTETFK